MVIYSRIGGRRETRQLGSSHYGQGKPRGQWRAIFDRKTGRAIGLTVAAANGSTDPTSPLYGIRPCKTWTEPSGEEQYNCPVIGVQPLKAVGNIETGEVRGILPTLGLTFDRG